MLIMVHFITTQELPVVDSLPASNHNLTTTAKGPYGWNQAIKSDAEAYKVFAVDDDKAKPLREAGFGTVLSHVRDGIARGTGAVVTLANEKENLVIIKERASAHYSFSKGTSTQSYPRFYDGYRLHYCARLTWMHNGIKTNLPAKDSI